MYESERITVGLQERSYPIIFGSGIVDQLPVYLDELGFPKTLAIITNDIVGPLYAETLIACLRAFAEKVEVITVPDGEQYKNLETFNTVINELINKGFDRSCGLIALGGGVVGDLTGFVAASYLRGVPFVQVPTTLLAQVDSSVGGKTAVNSSLGKNLIGAFYQPRLVLIDVAMLQTLPEREFKAGFAEVIKYGVIRDGEFFSWLEVNAKALLDQSPECLIQAIKRSCQIKADVVEYDEKESSLRAILNFGHTFGHAIEHLSGYGEIRHGEAVAIGMSVAATISNRLDYCSQKDVTRIQQLLLTYGLPTEIPDYSLDEYLRAIWRDKKVQHGSLRYVLNHGIGDCLIQELESPDSVFAEILAPPPSQDNEQDQADVPTSLLGKIAAYTEILSNDPQSTIFVSLSEAYRKLGMLDDALEIALNGTTVLKRHAPGFACLGRVYLKQGELSKAADAFDEALRLDAGNAQALKGMAEVCLGQEEPQRARHYLKSALEIYPDDQMAARMLDALGPEEVADLDGVSESSTELQNQETSKEAAADSSATATPIPTETVGDLYRKQGLLEEAAAIYRDILRVDPQRETVRSKLVEVKALLDGVPAAISEEVPEAIAENIDTLESPEPELDVSDGDPVEVMERWLANIAQRRAHVQ